LLLEATKGAGVVERGNSAVLAVLSEIALLGPVRREMAKTAAPELHAGGAAAVWQLADQGPLRMGDLASRLHVDLSVVSRQVGELVAAGFVDRHPDPADGRACVLSLTATGRAALDSAVGRLTQAFEPHLSGWGERDLLRIAAELRRLRDDLLAQ
jgi:DNA-binding MarR family transcriptional regulator